jgi:hypothetical protein
VRFTQLAACLKLVSCLADYSTLKIKATSSSETSVALQRNTWHYIPEDSTLQLQSYLEDTQTYTDKCILLQDYFSSKNLFESPTLFLHKHTHTFLSVTSQEHSWFFLAVFHTTYQKFSLHFCLPHRAPWNRNSQHSFYFLTYLASIIYVFLPPTASFPSEPQVTDFRRYTCCHFQCAILDNSEQSLHPSFHGAQCPQQPGFAPYTVPD